MTGCAPSTGERRPAGRDLVVNERHPERNTDVVLFVDSFADVRRGDRSTLDDAVRATATLASRYLERRDRVGLVTFGGVLRWLQPGMGLAQRFRLVDTLLETGVEPTYTWRDVSVIPARILPPKALVLAITPLVDSALRGDARGSPCSRVRPRGGRGRSDPDRRRRPGAAGAAGVSPLDPRARGPPRPNREARDRASPAGPTTSSSKPPSRR